MGNVVVKKIIDIEAVGTLRRSCHSKPELRLEVLENLLIAQCTGLVNLIYDYVVKMVLVVSCVDVILAHCLDSGEKIVLVIVLGVT